MPIMAGSSLCRSTDQQMSHSKWSLHSPDLNPADFYLWGFLKEHVYQNNPQTIPELKVAITQQIHGISDEECVSVIDNFA